MEGQGESGIKKRIIPVFIIYIFTILWFTVFNRTPRFHTAQFDLFWSYKEWIRGDWELGKEIIANIAMFIPFGFLLSSFLSKHRLIIPAAILFSLSIETLQLFLMRGLFEWDDVFSNTLGAALGIAVYAILKKIFNERLFRIVSISIGAAFVVVCLGVYIHGGGTIGVEADPSSRAYCFQIDESMIEEGKVELKGIAFRYENPTGAPELILHSTETGERLSLNVEYGVPRNDVNDYFLCDQDYMNTGFTAKGKIGDGEYEVLIKWPWSIALSTGVYVGSSIHYSPEKDFSPPSIVAPFVEEGILRVYRPDKGCWVYQWNGALYWVADKDFYFEEDGSTYIQYQLWTTQTDKLPEKRIENGWMWDNIGGSFEKYEVEGDFGEYRVMKRELPTAYSITSILTGYYKNGEWIWKEYFRPIYSFPGGETNEHQPLK